jgi:hypothetical protein
LQGGLQGRRVIRKNVPKVYARHSDFLKTTLRQAQGSAFGAVDTSKPDYETSGREQGLVNKTYKYDYDR